MSAPATTRTQALPSERAASPARHVAQAWAIARYEGLRLRRGRHVIARAFFFAGVLWVACLWAFVVVVGAESPFQASFTSLGDTVTTETTSLGLARLFRFIHLRGFYFLSIAVLFAGLFESEIGERTLHHLFLRPARREIVAVGKFLAGVLFAMSAGLIAWILASAVMLAVHGPAAAAGSLLSVQGLGRLLAYAGVLLLAAVGYGGVFMLSGVLVRWSALVALAILAWESLSTFLPIGFQRLTLIYWLESLLPIRTAPSSQLAWIAEPASWPMAVLVPLAVGLLCAAAAAWRARSLQSAYGASD